MPFIELGKDMRTVAMAALQAPDCGVPRPWLEMIRVRASAYAKNQSLLISESKRNHGESLTAREQEILTDLYNGLSRSEIAARRDLSVNTVRAAVKSIYEKLNAHKISDVIRIAVEQGLV